MLVTLGLRRLISGLVMPVLTRRGLTAGLVMLVMLVMLVLTIAV